VVKDWVARHSSRVTHVPPAAGAIAWAGLPGTDTLALAETARVKGNLLIVPGEHFGMGGYIRIGFGYHREPLEKALLRLDALLTAAASA
jgi:hypothetical protein